MLTNYSRNKIIIAIKNKNMLINNKAFKPNKKVIGNEIVNFNIIENNTTNWQAEKITIDIVYTDNDLIVINKPAGMITHPGAANPNKTLANALLFYDKKLKKIARAGIVHRLDKNTSGLLVVARNEKSRQFLIKQLENHSVKREYNAIVYGHIIAGGTIEKPIGRDKNNRIKQAITNSGKKAITHYRVIKKYNDFTLVKLLLETGRTHQIRLHMLSIGHPIVGDDLYSVKNKFPKGISEKLKTTIKNSKRQALHAKKLAFMHPTTKKKIIFKIPQAVDINNFLKILDEE